MAGSRSPAGAAGAEAGGKKPSANGYRVARATGREGGAAPGISGLATATLGATFANGRVTNGLRDHNGSARAANIANLASPADAPPMIRFSQENAKLFQFLAKVSTLGDTAKEHGGTLVVDMLGSINVQNVGGLASDSRSFQVNYVLKNPNAFRVIGDFHTHAYERSAGGNTGVSFSGPDIAELINQRMTISVLQSGPRTFAIVRTARAPTQINQDRLKSEVEALTNQLQNQRHSFPEASRIAAARTSAKYGLAYYEGTSGSLHRLQR